MNCKNCGVEVTQGRGSRRVWCSDTCRNRWRYHNEPGRAEAGRLAALAFLGRNPTYYRDRAPDRYCQCGTQLVGRQQKCPACKAPKCSACQGVREKGKQLCESCRHARALDRNRASRKTAAARARRMAWKKNDKHKRRALRLASDVTHHDETHLLSRAKTCPLCRCRMNTTPNHPKQKSIDHIMPINQGGRHTILNLRVVCRTCNRLRPYDGADLTQLPLCA